MRKEISLNEMRERVARLIYGDDWIGGLTDSEYELLREHPLTSRAIVRTDGSTIHLDHIGRCPAGSATKLDRAIGRQARMSAQFVTVDSWIQNHGLLVDPRHPADRKSFNSIVRAESRNGKSAPIEEKRRGPKPKIFPRLTAAMRDDVSSGRLSLADLKAMPDKELEEMYQGKRERVRVARQWVVSQLKKQLPTNTNKK
jgi:hypothetical protein